MWVKTATEDVGFPCRSVLVFIPLEIKGCVDFNGLVNDAREISVTYSKKKNKQTIVCPSVISECIVLTTFLEDTIKHEIVL